MDNQIKQSGTLFAGFRPCHIYDGRAAIFHRWVDEANTIPASPFVGGAPAGQFHTVNGLVEFEDGHMEFQDPVNITFDDTKELMSAMGMEAHNG